MAKISLNFSQNTYSDASLKVKASTVATSLDGNVYFPTLKENVVTLKVKITTFDDFLSRMESGNKQLTAQKKVARTDLVDTLCETGRLVQNISKGDEVILLSSGFDLNRQPTYVEILDQVHNVTVKPGKIPGTLLVEWDGVDHAHSYEVRYARLPITEATIYTIVTTSRQSIFLEGLVQGQQYAIQVAGVNSDPHRAWSIEVTSYVM
jgi:hypothetical protein